jgi:capsular polysaccharide biosynthesis protein
MVGRSNILRITVADRDRASALAAAELIAAAYSREAVRAGTDSDPPLIRSTVLTPARSLDQPLQPRPLRALAAGTLLGLLTAAAVVAMLWKPWRVLRPAPYWT